MSVSYPLITTFSKTFVISLVSLAVLFSCQNESLAPEDEVPLADYSMSLRQSIFRDFSELPAAAAIYNATIVENPAGRRLELNFEISQSTENAVVFSGLNLSIPLIAGQFDTAPGDYRISGGSTVPGSLQGHLAYSWQKDLLNHERFNFQTESISIKVSSANSSHLAGRMLVQLNQVDGRRTINGISEQVTLAYGGSQLVELVFDLDIRQP